MKSRWSKLGLLCGFTPGWWKTIISLKSKYKIVSIIIIWLAPPASRMTQIACCDWLPEREPSCPLGTTCCILQEKFPQILYWPSLFSQDGWILASFFFCEFMDLDFASELGQYPAILTSHLVNNPYILQDYFWNQFCITLQVVKHQVPVFQPLPRKLQVSTQKWWHANIFLSLLLQHHFYEQNLGEFSGLKKANPTIAY